MSYVRQKKACDINNGMFLKLKKRADRHVFKWSIAKAANGNNQHTVFSFIGELTSC